ncbi:MAG: hypothetical protein GOV01_02225 [Candidatus Altiarchaeota archaeon]|nr:hypothetical protein [Candidatus Altiarchaeota archaeon]
MLGLGYASCGSPYIVQFSDEHITYPPGDPKLAAISHPDIINRLEYGISKLLCPGKSLKSVEKATKFVIESDFVKNIASEYGISIASNVLDFVADQFPKVFSDSLSPDALGYGGTKLAMESIIGTAVSSEYTCDSLENAARLYYTYGRDDYQSDVCSKHNSIKELLAILKTAKRVPSLSAVSLSQELKPYFIDIFSRDEYIGNLVRERKTDRVSALKRLVDGLDKSRLCHESVGDYIPTLIKMANLDSPLFFPLYDSLKSFKESCPFVSSNYILDRIENGTAYFTNGSMSVPLVQISQTTSNDRVLEYLPLTFSVNLSGPVPLNGDDHSFESLVLDDTTNSKSLSFSMLSFIVLAGILAIGLWVRAKDN